jgi:hypothetical protein
MGKNPAYAEWEKKNGSASAAQPQLTQQKVLQQQQIDQEAMAVITNLEDLTSYDQLSSEKHNLAASTSAALSQFNAPNIKETVGLTSEECVKQLSAVFRKYEMPLGMLAKLLQVQQFDRLEFIMDDSGSMNSISDTRDIPQDANNRPNSRWTEAIARFKTMIEVLAYIPTPLIILRFLNRPDVLQIQHAKGQTPEQFISATNAMIDGVVSRPPSGTTPALEVLQRSFAEGRGKRISRYFFCDGQPNGGEKAKRNIKNLAMNRHDPQNNPLTFLSCTGEDEEVEWMKDTEEVAPFCSEYDDYDDEKEEVLKDQGLALPFTRGFYLVGQIISAMNPDDLDALDESVPLSKKTLDSLLGIEQNLQDYAHYFQHFQQAQQRRRIESSEDRVKKEIDWGLYYNDFVSVEVSRMLPAVQEFKRRLAVEQQRNVHHGARRSDDPECCILL